MKIRVRELLVGAVKVFLVNLALISLAFLMIAVLYWPVILLVRHQIPDLIGLLLFVLCISLDTALLWFAVQILSRTKVLFWSG